MAPLIIKSTSIFLIISLVFSSYGVVEAGSNFDSIISKFFSRAIKEPPLLNASPEGSTNYPKGLDMAGSAIPSVADHVSKKIGERLALKYFGPEGEKGFRWGWKANKYYLKVDKRCQEYKQKLGPNCNRAIHSNYFRPDCVMKCIVVVARYTTVENTPLECYDSCDDSIYAKCTEFFTGAECGS